MSHAATTERYVPYVTELLFVTSDDTYTIEFDHYLRSLGVDPYEGQEEYRGCECEIDWNCGCGRYGGATWLEVRYDGRED